MCFPIEGSGLCYLNRPGDPEIWLTDRRHPRRMSSHQGGGKGRVKLLWEVLVHFLHVSQADGDVDRLIGAATAPNIKPAQSLARPAKPVTVKTPGARARTVCASASAKTAAPSCRGRQGRAFIGTSTWSSMHRPQTPCISGRR